MLTVKKYISLLLVLLHFAAFAQQNVVLYNMPAIHQSLYANPGQLPQCKVNVGLPLLSSLYFNVGNEGFKLTQLIKKRSDDSLRLDIDNVISKLRSNNRISQALQVDIISFGFSVKKSYFSFSIIEKEHIQFRYPKSLLNFIWNGNGAFLGEEMKFNVGLNAMHYREYGIGYAHSFSDKFSAGIKLKRLFGKSNASIATCDIRFKTGDPYFDYTAKANIDIHTSYNETNYDWNNTQNKGLALDVGAVYKLNDRFSFSGSLLDVGSIKWKSNIKNYVSKNPNAEFKFDGVDIKKFIDKNGVFNGDSAAKYYQDSIINVFKIDTTYQAYRTSLPAQFYIGSNFILTKKQNIGLLLHGDFFNKKVYPGIALSYNLKVANWFSTSVSYAMVNRSYNNIGLGFAITGPVQLYAVSDNVMGFILPQSSKTFNLRAGINLCFGRGKKEDKLDFTHPTHSARKGWFKKRDTDSDGIPDKTDKCPLENGLLELNGCPDKDHDNITDKLDSCPDTFGLLEFNGCPDADGDKIIDKNDSCPTLAGTLALNGCPDTDGDNIIDKKDSCPSVAGVPQLFGCPDKDGDGIADSSDKCPDEKGTLSAKGCPDSDSDGIADSQDRCPNLSGIIEREGCPPSKLYIVDKQGTIMAVSIINKDGLFNFTNLEMDANTLFKLESYDVLISNEVVISNGKTIYVARKGADGYFHYENISADANNMSLMHAIDMPIQLKQQEAEKVKNAMETLVFDSGKDMIRPSSVEALNTLIELLKQNPIWKLKLTGHTDNKASTKLNINLSKKRVEAVKNYLVKNGIEAQRIVLKWYGPTKPIAPNHTEEGRQKNRRVEFLIVR